MPQFLPDNTTITITFNWWYILLFLIGFAIGFTVAVEFLLAYQKVKDNNLK